MINLDYLFLLRVLYMDDNTWMNIKKSNKKIVDDS